ncbi:MAG: hypothetical protein IE923_03635 [Micrococcales bacterium]|nr:hypothetical protein [Micrococcales bacterium]
MTNLNTARGTRWCTIGASEWTVVRDPDGGRGSAVVLRVAGARPVAILASWFAFVGLCGYALDRFAFGLHLLPLLVLVGWFGLGLLRGDDRTVNRVGRMAGARLLAPVRLAEHDNGAEVLLVHSADAADAAVEDQPYLAAVVHELMWAASSAPGAYLRDELCSVHGRDADATDGPWRAWTQFVRRTAATLGTEAGR